MPFRAPEPYERNPDGIPSLSFMEQQLGQLEDELSARREQADRALDIYSRSRRALTVLSKQQAELEDLRGKVADMIGLVLKR